MTDDRIAEIARGRDFEAEARALLFEKLSNHPDPDVRTITNAFGIPPESVSRVADALLKKHLLENDSDK